VGKGKGKGQRKGIAKRGGCTKAKGAFVQRLAGTSFEELHCKLEKKLGLYQVPCVFTCCSICFQISIYISISLTGFPHGGFSRVMLTKNTCVHLSCLLSIFSL
jgi:hypothetical protein